MRSSGAHQDNPDAGDRPTRSDSPASSPVSMYVGIRLGETRGCGPRNSLRSPHGSMLNDVEIAKMDIEMPSVKVEDSAAVHHLAPFEGRNVDPASPALQAVEGRSRLGSTRRSPSHCQDENRHELWTRRGSPPLHWGVNGTRPRLSPMNSSSNMFIACQTSARPVSTRRVAAMNKSWRRHCVASSLCESPPLALRVKFSSSLLKEVSGDPNQAAPYNIGNLFELHEEHWRGRAVEWAHAVGRASWSPDRLSVGCTSTQSD